MARPVISALKDLSPEALDWSKVSVFFTGECLVSGDVMVCLGDAGRQGGWIALVNI